MTLQRQIKTGQIAFLLFTVLPVTKLMMLPAILSHYAQASAWLAMLFLLLCDFAALAAIMLAFKASPESTFYEMLHGSLGKYGAKLVLLAYAAYFLLRAVAPMMEQKYLFLSTLYETMPQFAATIPFVLAAGYACYKGANSLGRNACFTVFTAAISLAALFALSVSEFRFSNLLPVLENDLSPLGQGMLHTSAWFGDSCLVLAFLGNITARRGRIRGVLWGGGIAMLVTLIFLLLITGIFGPLTSSQLSAVTKISKYSLAFSNMGRIDWIAILLLMISVFFASAAMLYASVTCLCQAFSLRNNLWAVIPVCAVVLAGIFLLRDDYLAVYAFLQEGANYVAFALQYLIPYLLPLLAARGKRQARYAG